MTNDENSLGFQLDLCARYAEALKVLLVLYARASELLTRKLDKVVLWWENIGLSDVSTETVDCFEGDAPPPNLPVGGV